jgi:hypothetical protein
MEPPGAEVGLTTADVRLLAPSDVQAMGDSVLAHCVRDVLAWDPFGGGKIAEWDSFVS